MSDTKKITFVKSPTALFGLGYSAGESAELSADLVEKLITAGVATDGTGETPAVEVAERKPSGNNIAAIVSDAKKTASNIITEAENKASGILIEAENRVDKIIQAADEVKKSADDILAKAHESTTEVIEKAKTEAAQIIADAKETAAQSLKVTDAETVDSEFKGVTAKEAAVAMVEMVKSAKPAKETATDKGSETSEKA